MKEAIFVLVTYFVVNCWGQTSPASAEHLKPWNCANVTRISVAVNLLDKECLKQSSSIANFMREDDNNSVDVNNVEMDMYAVCLLKKASIMNDEGKVNLNLDIMKIVRHLYKKTDERGLGLAFILKSLEKCRNLSGTNQFIAASKIMKCLLDHQETILWCNQY